MSELDQDEEVGAKDKGAKSVSAKTRKPILDTAVDAKGAEQPKPPLTPEALKRIEGALPLREDDPTEIQGYTVVGRDPDDGELLVEFPEREPIVAMGLIKCPSCEGRMYVTTSKGRLATRSYTVCTNDNCYHLKRSGKRKRGSVERRLTTNVRRFDELGVRARRTEREV